MSPTRRTSALVAVDLTPNLTATEARRIVASSIAGISAGCGLRLTVARHTVPFELGDIIPCDVHVEVVAPAAHTLRRWGAALHAGISESGT